MSQQDYGDGGSGTKPNGSSESLWKPDPVSIASEILLDVAKAPELTKFGVSRGILAYKAFDVISKQKNLDRNRMDLLSSLRCNEAPTPVEVQDIYGEELVITEQDFVASMNGTTWGMIGGFAALGFTPAMPALAIGISVGYAVEVGTKYMLQRDASPVPPLRCGSDNERTFLP